MKNEHFNWIDYGKSLAIFLVVLFHTHCNSTLDHVINAFAMPTFFFMSGFVFSYERNPSYGAFAYKRFRQLVVPYLWINLIAYALWVVVLRHYGDDAENELAWSTPLIGVFAGVPPLLKHDIPLWSLLCFFMVEIIFYPLCKAFLRDWVVGLIFLALAFCVSSITDSGRLPLTLGPSLAGIAFYSLGHFYRRIQPAKRKAPNLLWLMCGVFGLTLSVRYNTEVEFFICRYGNFLLFLLGAVSGITIVTIMMKMIGGHNTEPRAIKFIARSTLLICGFHLLAFAIIKGILLFGFDVEPAVLSENLVNGLAFAVSAFCLTLPVAYIVFRYFPSLVDK